MMAGQPLASQRLHAISRQLTAEGLRGVRLEMNRTLRGATKPLVAAVRAAADEQLPKAGGLNKEQSGQKIRVSVLTGARTAGVRIRTRTRGSMQTDKGYVRHPTPSMRGYDRSYWHWVQQEIPKAAGWWSRTLARNSRAVTPLMIAAMDRVARRIRDAA